MGTKWLSVAAVTTKSDTVGGNTVGLLGRSDIVDGEASLRSLISSNLYLQAINGIQIDSSVLIGPNVKIISANHDLSDYSRWLNDDPIIIKKKCHSHCE